ncbi:uncharacterized protein RG961_014632 [Leptosomus discolor]
MVTWRGLFRVFCIQPRCMLVFLRFAYPVSSTRQYRSAVFGSKVQWIAFKNYLHMRRLKSMFRSYSKKTFLVCLRTRCHRYLFQEIPFLSESPMWCPLRSCRE